LSTIINSLKGGQIKPEEVNSDSIALMQTTLKDYLIDVFGLKPLEENTHSKLNEVMQVIIELRKEAKLKKDFATSDAIRNKLADAGVQLKDEKDGTMSFTVN
jgi:cysteinyl-tRNA synthetase